MTLSPLRRHSLRRPVRPGVGRTGLVLALLGLLLRLAVPGISVPAPASPWTGLQSALGDVAIELCLHAGQPDDPSDDSPGPGPRHRPGHDCIACCSPASLAAVLPQAATIPLPRGAAAVDAAAPASAGPALSIYAARQRGPPLA